MGKRLGFVFGLADRSSFGLFLSEEEDREVVKTSRLTGLSSRRRPS